MSEPMGRGLSEPEEDSYATAAGFGCAAGILGLAASSGLSAVMQRWNERGVTGAGILPFIIVSMWLGMGASIGMADFGLRIAAEVFRGRLEPRRAARSMGDATLFNPTIDGPR